MTSLLQKHTQRTAITTSQCYNIAHFHSHHVSAGSWSLPVTAAESGAASSTSVTSSTAVPTTSENHNIRIQEHTISCRHHSVCRWRQNSAWSLSAVCTSAWSLSAVCTSAWSLSAVCTAQTHIKYRTPIYAHVLVQNKVLHVLVPVNTIKEFVQLSMTSNVKHCLQCRDVHNWT